MIAKTYAWQRLRNAWMTNIIKEYGGRYGPTAHQFVEMGKLAQRDRCHQQQLVVRASSDPNTVRAMLLLLEGRGFVSRKQHPVDGRARSVSLTRKGRHVCERLRAACEPFLAQVVSAYQPGEVAILLELLGRLPPVMVPHAGSLASCQPSVIAQGQ